MTNFLSAVFSNSSSDKSDAQPVKRGHDDVSVNSNTSVPDSKHFDLHVPVNSVTPTEGHTLIRVLEQMFNNLSVDIGAKIETIASKLDEFNSRLAAIEEREGSQDLAIADLTERVKHIEQFKDEIDGKIDFITDLTAELKQSGPAWEPTGSSIVNVRLYGDSNSGGKVKFGEGQGTLGAALPGSAKFVPTVDQLPEPGVDASLNEVSDLVIAVGTNNLKNGSCSPADLAKSTYSYVKKVHKAHPSCHVYCPGVLPTSTPWINDKIKMYNYYLNDMCDRLGNTTFIDVKVLGDNTGRLLGKFAVGNDDPLHLSKEGLKMYFSRIKHALRSRHGLPTSRGNYNRANATKPGRFKR